MSIYTANNCQRVKGASVIWKKCLKTSKCLGQTVERPKASSNRDLRSNKHMNTVCMNGHFLHDPLIIGLHLSQSFASSWEISKLSITSLAPSNPVFLRHSICLTPSSYIILPHFIWSASFLWPNQLSLSVLIIRLTGSNSNNSPSNVFLTFFLLSK